MRNRKTTIFLLVTICGMMSQFFLSCEQTESPTEQTYTVTYKDGIDTLDIQVPIDSKKYKAGDKVTVKFDGIGTRDGFNFKGWTDGITSYMKNATQSFNMGHQDVILTAQWESDVTYYSITIDDDIMNGTVNVNKTSAVAGETIILNALPDSGYVLSSWSVIDEDNNSVLVTNNSFIMPAKNVIIYALFSDIPPNNYAINISSEITNGTVSANFTYAAAGAMVVITISPNLGYQLETISVNGNGAPITVVNYGTNTKAFSMPAGAVNINATFTPITYNINLSNFINGNITVNTLSAIVNEVVTISIAIPVGYQCNTITVTKSTDNTTIPVSGTGYVRTFVMPASNVTISANFGSVTYSPYTNDSNAIYVTFGRWPQSRKTDNVIIYEHNSETVGEFTYYQGSDNEKYVKLSKDNVDSYFKVEPIKWRVLTTEFDNDNNANTPNKKLLLAENILIDCAFYDFLSLRTLDNCSIHENNYKYSRIRAFLNGLSYYTKDPDAYIEQVDETFLNKGFLHTAFNAEEKELIEITEVVNNEINANPDKNATYFENGSNGYAWIEPTYDKIFLLSMKEATKAEYGLGENFNTEKENLARIRKHTQFAFEKGGYQYDNALGGTWWLRSPQRKVYGSNGKSSMIVNPPFQEFGGSVGGTMECNCTTVGIVPALCLE